MLNSTDGFTNEEVCNALESIVEIEQLESSVEQVDLTIEQILLQNNKLNNIESIYTIAREDNFLTKNSGLMVKKSIELSLSSLGLSISKESEDEEPLKTKNKTAEKIIAFIKKLAKKLEKIVREILLKVLTTLSFNNKILKNLIYKFETRDDDKEIVFSTKDATELARRFATVAILSNKFKEFSLGDIEHSLLSINDGDLLIDSLKKITEDIVEKKDVIKTEIETNFFMTNKHNLFFKLTEEENKSFLSNIDLIKVIRVDGINLMYISLYSNFKNNIHHIDVVNTKVKTKIFAKMRFTKVPTTDQILKQLLKVKDINDNLNNYISNVFRGIDSIDKLINKYYEDFIVEQQRNKDESGLDLNPETEILDRIKKLQNMTPKLAQAGVMNKFKHIRNIIYLAKTTAKLRKI